MFDILPIYGHLQPGDQQQVIFSFYGHENVSREVVAQCHVDEGPTYEITLRGEASVISYSLDSAHIDFGLQVCIQGSFAQTYLLRSISRQTFKARIRAMIGVRDCWKWQKRQDLPLLELPTSEQCYVLSSHYLVLICLLVILLVLSLFLLCHLFAHPCVTHDTSYKTN